MATTKRTREFLSVEIEGGHPVFYACQTRPHRDECNGSLVDLFQGHNRCRDPEVLQVSGDENEIRKRWSLDFLCYISISVLSDLVADNAVFLSSMK